ncbi:Biotin-requiring enzyme [Ostertagia ostertagi]
MLQTTVNEQHNFSITQEDGQWLLNDAPANLDTYTADNGILSVLYNGKSYTAIVEKTDKAAKEVTIRVNGQRYKVGIKEPIDQLLASMGLDLKAMQKIEPVKAPMPGMILKVLVTPGQQISKGDGLLVLEAMKMENVLKATGNATVKDIRVQERTAVEKGAILIDLE